MIPVSLIRIFDPTKVPPDTPVEDFTSLDTHPDLILYEGYQELESDRLNLVRRPP
jgi:hypothetical protein